MEIDLIKFSKFHILQIADNNFYIYDSLSTENGYIMRNNDNEISYTDTTITFTSASFETKYNVGSASIIKLKQKMQELVPSIAATPAENKIRQCKLLILGDAGVGKTTLINRHRTGFFTKDYNATLGVNVQPLIFDINGIKTVFKVWDIAGSEINNNAERYFVAADCAIIMFDVTNSLSFKNCNTWYNLLKQEQPNIPVILCGNKVDIGPCLSMTYVEMKKYTLYFAISAKSNYNYEKPFYALADILNKK